MRKNTRENLLQQAELLFSQKGFYGTSINDVAAEVSVSKQALLHHFPSKEKLYRAVLERATEQLAGFLAAAKNSTEDPRRQLLHLLTTMSNGGEQAVTVTILLMRELLDNRDRAEKAHKWYLRPFLDELTDIVERGKNQGYFTDVSALAFVYQLLGSTQYFLVSQPTLQQLYNAEECQEHKQQHLMLLRGQLEIPTERG